MNAATVMMTGGRIIIGIAGAVAAMVIADIVVEIVIHGGMMPSLALGVIVGAIGLAVMMTVAAVIVLAAAGVITATGKGYARFGRQALGQDGIGKQPGESQRRSEKSAACDGVVQEECHRASLDRNRRCGGSFR